MRLVFALGGTDFGRSGIGTYVRAVLPRMARLLAARGDTLVALGTPTELRAYEEDLDGVDRASLPAWLDRPGPSALWYLTRAGDLAARVGADVMLLPAANRRTTARSPVPTVAVVHDLAQLRVRRKYDPLRMAYLRFAVVGALRSADGLVAISTVTRTDLAEALGRDPETIQLVPNGVDCERFTPATTGDPRVTRARRDVDLHDPYLLYPSRLEHPGKNHLRLLRAFAKSAARDTHVLALVGADWGAQALIEETVRELGLGERVRLLGFVSEDTLTGLVVGADAVVMVGLHEGFGLPALEALSAGRPVCAAEAGALPEVVGPLGALADPLDEESIAKELERCVLDEAFRHRAAEEGPRWASARSWDATAEGLVQACVAARHGRGALSRRSSSRPDRRRSGR